MSMIKTTKAMRRLIKRFAQEESGMTLPTLALAFMALSGFIGTSIDVARLQLVQSRLSFALDAAGLAAGSTMNTTNLETELTKYLNVNFPSKYMGTSTPQLDSRTSSDNLVIDIVATTQMPTTFMNVLGISEMTVTAKTQVTRTSSGLELVMALDNTGSMSGTKLTALKSAATSLVNILYGSKTTVPDLWIGLVPFSQAVNIGKTRTTWIDQTNFATLNWATTSWSGCVDARDSNSGDIVDDPPTVQTYKAYYSPSTDNRPYPYNTYWYLYANRWITNRTPLTYASPLTTSLGPNKYCPQALTALTSNKTTILSGINSMTAIGNTHVGLGAIWGWNMLSPRWRGLWGGEMDANALPLDYGTKHMNKALILLTDGANTMSSTIFTAYGYLSDGRLGSTSNTSTAVSSLNSKLTSVCTAMKERGIYVYTIALGNPGTTIQNLLKGCASADNYYFNSPTSSELTSVFNSIADSLSNLRISQ
ncbi:MAG: pilus assembly protein TadG-related protein [Alphaproteobacteria bacterium]|nr:pilus assembly protein TadG-related protein [Alphaproteobacteria bacterium]